MAMPTKLPPLFPSSILHALRKEKLCLRRFQPSSKPCGNVVKISFEPLFCFKILTINFEHPFRQLRVHKAELSSGERQHSLWRRVEP